MSRRAFLVLLLLLLVVPAKAADCPWYYRMMGSLGIWQPQAVTLSTGIRVEPIFDRGFHRLDSIKITDEFGHEVIYERTNRSLKQLCDEQFYPPEFFYTGTFGGKVLDVGTGNGQLVFDLKAKDADVQGLDVFLTPKQIKSGLFRQADVRDTGYPTGEFKVIFATETILSYSDAAGVSRKADYHRRVLGELRRILVDDGVLRVSTVPLPTTNDSLGRIVVDEVSLQRQYAGTGMRVKSYQKRIEQRASVRGWIELEKVP